MSYSKELEALHMMQQIYASLFSVTNKVQVQGDCYFNGLTARQFLTLLAILHLPEDETTFKNIAMKLGTTKQNISSLVSSLKEKGVVTLKPSKLDKRANNVLVTERGKDILLSCGKASIYFMADIFQKFTHEELKTFWTLLQKLYQFDGVSQSGLEEDVSCKLDQAVTNDYLEALEYFKWRREQNGV
ncbi:MarR family winged helix-turn-helix transcriptional regulator [Paenibacillus melissococcoides]|uniref:MarR family winged helix-turn-helix transcriptional regulator n=1 Tax=Paenibacillus melissococcoides TaxID=2912268 RepID=A0ABM9FYR8_9BACL|nr:MULTISPECIES: MarR family winged helix-turn-helix transcriptional regulator [Paenibacillus]MEB9896574.1 MarR family winged helix-turn-helix transcriptional regulator [Bacillus cereus]CAH8244328.1 MarR family winged helix-turn-helix transcriptional regulator [Paenibacillus melissococcoides]CAH8703427.1 MarR family winged helix-turn-helix transcriptional regulator [Paenibacillus melissococcoides]CAH8705842.1 MarR family winged helix-turn-helix transcriptional regulator [Paenibacillus melissoco